MADMQDALGDFLSDPEKLSQIMSLAQNFIGNQNSEESFMPEENKKNDSKNVNHDLNFDMTGELMSKAMPFISRIAQGNKAVNTQKTNLLTALSPFVAEEISKEFRHAVKLISIARLFKSVVGEINITSFKPQN